MMSSGGASFMSKSESEKRENEVLRRMLKTPPKPRAHKKPGARKLQEAMNRAEAHRPSAETSAHPQGACSTMPDPSREPGTQGRCEAVSLRNKRSRRGESSIVVPSESLISTAVISAGVEAYREHGRALHNYVEGEPELMVENVLRAALSEMRREQEDL